jgi:hypothetical protein
MTSLMTGMRQRLSLKAPCLRIEHNGMNRILTHAWIDVGWIDD